MFDVPPVSSVALLAMEYFAFYQDSTVFFSAARQSGKFSGNSIGTNFFTVISKFFKRLEKIKK